VNEIISRDSWRWQHIVIPEIRACWHCGAETRFVQVDFEAALHPGACTSAKWAEFDDANRGLPPATVQW
jgi:hypothetical protein